jgi:hypothetical protein
MLLIGIIRSLVGFVTLMVYLVAVLVQGDNLPWVHKPLLSLINNNLALNLPLAVGRK